MRAMLFCAGMLMSGVLANAAPTDIFYLQIPGVTGEVTNSRYAGWIQVSAFSAGITTVTAGGGGTGAGAGRPSCKPLTIIKPLDTTSPELAKDAAVGSHLSTVNLVALSGGGDAREFLRFTLKNAIITSVLFGGDTSVSSRTESLTIAAEQLEIIATPQRADGGGGQTVTTQFNCSTAAA